MKRVIVILLGILFISFEYRNSQNISVSSEGERKIENDDLAKIIKSRVKQKHVFSEFCNKYSEIAILCHLDCGIPTSVQLAQAIAESGGGKSELAKVANNLFGMKYYKEIFDKEFPNCEHIIPYFWMPKYTNATDPSARTLCFYA